MLRTLVCLSVGLMLLAGGFVAAEEAKDNANRGKEIHGKVVRVDLDRGVIILRVGEGATAKEQEFKMDATAKYFGTNNKELQGGIRSGDLRQGVDVRLMTDPNGTSARELRLGLGGAQPNRRD